MLCNAEALPASVLAAQFFAFRRHRLKESAWDCIHLHGGRREILCGKKNPDIPRILGLCAEAERTVSRVSTAKGRRSRP